MSTLLQTKPHSISPDQLLLDPNNYRFHDIPGFKFVTNRARYAETAVQDRALKYLRDTEAFSLASLRESILANGFVPVEQIVVERYGGTDEAPTFLVIEGNRRVATVKLLLMDHAAGSTEVPLDVLQSLQQLPVIEILGDAADRAAYQKTLMAIRHVGGIKPWGPYQQAKLVVEMFDSGVGSFTTVAQKIGIPAREVARRYRASKALQQMEEDEEFGEYAEPRLYATFHEAISQPKVKEWLGFSDDTFTATKDDARSLFYELLSPRETDDGQPLPAKLDIKITEVRKLKDIVDKPGPMEVLADPERTFDDAVKAAKDETAIIETGLLEHSLSAALNALRRPGVDAWSAPTPRADELWAEIQTLIDSVNKLMGKN